MLICISNLIKTERESKEISLLPVPLYYKLIDSQMLQFNRKSLISTDLPKENWFVIDQLIDHFQHNEKKFELERPSEKNSLNTAEVDNLISSLCEKKFPQLDLKSIERNQNAIEQGYVLFSEESTIYLKADSLQGIYYGIQTIIQLLNSTNSKNLLSQVAATSKLTIII
ncbi:MAG: glycoside hydrolase family 20 zincin-like fold domain-containing protein [Promethearchaeota archaeon]